MEVIAFPAGPLGCNCSIVLDEAARAAIVIDPGGDFPRIRAELEAAGLRVTAIVHTHTHIDHVGATAELQEWSGASAMIHEEDRFLYDLLPVQANMLGIPLPRRADVTSDLVDGHCLRAGDVEVGVLHTPGHTPGSVSFLVSGRDGSVVFTGDTLFRGGIGRTDLWGGDSPTILRSLRDRLLTLGDDTVVVPGHGPGSTIGAERRGNPFLRG